MRAIAGIEMKRAARALILWLGVVAVVTVGRMNAGLYWPVVPLDVARSYEALLALAACAFLFGAVIALRDKTSGTTALVQSTPGGVPLLAAARLAGVAGAAAVAGALSMLVVAALSYARGGLGVPDPALLLDAAALTSFGACLGFGFGFFTGSRVVCLFAAPSLAALVFWLEGSLSAPVAQGLWLLPHATPPTWYGPLGYLPDVWPIHALYLIAAAALTSCVIVAVAARRAEMKRVWLRGVLAGAVSFALFSASAGWLVMQPEAVLVVGTSHVIAEDGSSAAYRKAGKLLRSGLGDVDDGSATACTTVDGVEACVFPEYGVGFARVMAETLALIEPLRALPGLPTRVRMTPTYTNDHCTSTGEYLVPSTYAPEVTTGMMNWEAQEAFQCALRSRAWNGTKEAVSHWVSMRVTKTMEPREIDPTLPGQPSYLTVSLAMAQFDVQEVVDRLAPLWDDIRKGKTRLPELGRAFGVEV